MVWLIVLVALGLLAGVVLLFALWIRWLWHGASKRRRAILLVVVLPLFIGGLQVIVGLIKGFGAVGGESVDPSQKARILAEGISEAMNCIAFGGAVAIVPLVAGLLILTWMARRSEGPGRPGG